MHRRKIAFAVVLWAGVLLAAGFGWWTLRQPLNAAVNDTPPESKVVDPSVWKSLANSPDRMTGISISVVAPDDDPSVAFRAERGVLLLLNLLQKQGVASDIIAVYGRDDIRARLTGHAIRFLSATPDIQAIRLASELPPSEDPLSAAKTQETLTATGAFAGTVVREGDGAPVAGIRIRAYQQTGALTWVVVTTTVTGADGHYTVKGLLPDPAIHRAEFHDPSGDYVSEFWDNVQEFSLATPFTVPDGGTKLNVNAALAPAGHISGKVTANVGGDGIANISVSAWTNMGSSWQRMASAVSATDGTYDIGGLGASSYRLLFRDAIVPARYLPEVYDNVLYVDITSLEAGTPVNVTAGSTTANINAGLGDYGKLSGTVIGPSDVGAIEGIWVDVYLPSATPGVWNWVSGDTTDSTGFYEAGGLDTDDYRVEFTDPKGQFATETYDNQPSLDVGTDVHVELGDETPNVDATLDLASDTVNHELAQGWNLISIPVDPDDPATSTVLEPIASDYEIIYAYDGCVGDPWTRYTHDPNVPPGFNTLLTLNSADGYWIEAATTTLTANGIHPISNEISLCPGWNLIGYASVTDRPVEEVLAPIDGKYSIVWAYEPTDTSDPWKSYDPEAPDFINDLHTMKIWYGYWIMATEPATLVIDGR